MRSQLYEPHKVVPRALRYHKWQRFLAFPSIKKKKKMPKHFGLIHDKQESCKAPLKLTKLTVQHF